MNKKKIIALIITVGLFVVILHKIDWHQLLQTFRDFNFKNMVWIGSFYVLTLYIRGVRWRALLLNDRKYSSLHLGEVFTVGSMLNIFLPMRAGDMYRAYYLGSVKCERKLKVFGSIILERILDGVSVFFILIAAVLMYCKQQWILNLSYGVGTVFLGALAGSYIVYKNIDWICEKAGKYEKIAKFCNHAAAFMKGFGVLDDLRCFALSVLTSFVIWGIECYVAYLILCSFDLGLGFAASLFVISLISFSTAIPSISTFLGPYQVAYILALGIFAVDKSTALAVSTIHQMILMLMLTAIGMYYFLKFNIPVKEATKS